METQIPSVKPPWSGLGKRIESMTRKALYDFNMLKKGGNVAIALSGGKDSLSLLYMLHAISGRGFPPFKLYAIHVSGEFSCGAGVNEGYLRAICDELEVPFIVKESDQKRETLECYSCSRERRRLLFEAAKSVDAHTVAFGHHKDDNAQTLLMNLLHKAEFCPLLPNLEMEDFDVTIIRPLIYVSEQEMTSFAEHHGFRRIMCQCPVGQNSMRKKTDLLMQDMEQLYPNARSNIARAGLVYGSDKARRRRDS